MTKQQFLEELKKALSGEVSPEAMMDAYSYYSGYIDEQMQSGKTEEQVNGLRMWNIQKMGVPEKSGIGKIDRRIGKRKRSNVNLPLI